MSYAIRNDGKGFRRVSGPGDLEAWETFSATEPEVGAVPDVPRAVTMRQARLALLGAGMLDAVNTAVANMPGDAGVAARIEWEYSQEVQRDKELVLALAPLLGLTSEQLDALFITAATL